MSEPEIVPTQPGPGGPTQVARTTEFRPNDPDATDPGLAADSLVARIGPGGASAGRYTLLGEIARGGMGSVIRGHDPDLGRDLALKVLLDEHRDRHDLVDRFVEEAQICGQLQHPGIVPVYELGSLADHRPYFTMKLVQGQTLAELLAVRDGTPGSATTIAGPDGSPSEAAAVPEATPTPHHELPRFLSIFEAVCQTVAYAHARGVLHRDLKPSNVMVGAFGEVQVMDWGLAKVLPRHGDLEPEKGPAAAVFVEAAVSTARTRGDSDLSQSGSVLGTPAYMAPEQARGETERISRRADVFALGSILCEILTGGPAFCGETTSDILRAAARADTAAAMERLGRCQVDAELLSLARECLATEPEGRPADAGVVAARLTSYLAGVQERLRATELARAAEAAHAAQAEAKAAAERRARRSTRALAITVILAGGALALGWRWVELDRSHRIHEATTRVNAAIREATRLRGQAQGADVGELLPWGAAEAAVEKARDLLVPEVEPAIRRHVEELVAEVRAERAQAESAAAAADRDRQLIERFADIRSARTDDRLGDSTDAAYGAAFKEVGIDPDRLATVEAGRRIKERPHEVAMAMAMALDDWSSVRRDLRRDATGADRLANAAELADPDPWRNQLRTALEIPDREARRSRLVQLIGTIGEQGQGPISFDLLGKALGDVGAKIEAESVLRRGARLYAGDLWLNYDLARALEKLHRGEEAIRYYTAARMIQPETAHEMGHALVRSGDVDDGVSVFKDLVRLRPGNGRHLLCLGETLRERGHKNEARKTLTEAAAVLRNTIEGHPNDYYSYLNLASALRNLHDLDPGQSSAMLSEAMTLSREAARINPNDVQVHTSIGMGLLADRRNQAAIDEFREALRIDPEDAVAHQSLGVALEGLGRLDEAIACFREAVRLEPGRVDYLISLSTALSTRGLFDEALAHAREASRENPGHAPTLGHLGFCYYRAGRFDEAREAYREALSNDPDNDFAMNALAWNLATAPGHEKNDPGEALALARRAAARAPQNATNANTLGVCLYRAGRLDEAVEMLRRSARLNRGHDASDWFFLAMALYRLGEVREAAEGFLRGINTLRNFPQEGPEYANFWAEASDLFGALGPGPSAFLARSDPDRAMLELRRAVAAGNLDRRQLLEDPSYEGLRPRPEFGAILNGAKPAPSTPH